MPTVIVFGAGHVDGAKTYMGYTEDVVMLDLAKRKAEYAMSMYENIETHVMNVRGIASYPGIEDFIRGFHANLCSLEHSNADDSIEEPNEPDRVVVFRTVKNPGDGCCRVIGDACNAILETPGVYVQHRYNDRGEDYYGAIKRAMQGGCSDAWLIEHGFHTNPATRAKLTSPDIRQLLAVNEIDAMAKYYNWTKKPLPGSGGGSPEMVICKYGDVNSKVVTALQAGLLRLKYKFVGTSGTVYTAPSGGFFSATKSALAQFLNDIKMDGDGSEFTAEANAVLLIKLSELPEATGITQAQLDAEKAKVSDLTLQLLDASNKLLIATNKIENAKTALG